MTKVRFSEAVTILLVMIAILGTAVIKFGVSPEMPVLLVIALVILWAKLRRAQQLFLSLFLS